MNLAEISKIRTVEHSLIRLKSGQLAYITKRVDRNKKEKLHMEDMCQLTERLTEQKYKGSYEQIAKKILSDKECINRKSLAVNGHDLIEAGITDGKTIGLILSLLLDEVIDKSTENRKLPLIERAGQIAENLKKKDL